MLRTPDEVFFNILPGVVVHYSSTWAVPLAALVTLLFLALLVLGFRRKRLTFGDFALAILAFLGSLIATLILLILLWMALKAVNSNYQVFLIGYYGITFAILGLAAFGIAIMGALFLWLRRSIRPENLASGALFWWTILSVLSSLFFPGGSYLFTWPLLFAVLVLGWMLLTTRHPSHPWLRAPVLSLAMVPGIVLLIAAILFLLPLAIRLDAELGLPTLPVPLLLVLLLVGLFIPQFVPFSEPPHTSAGEHRVAENKGKRLRMALGRWLLPVASLLISIILLTTAIGTSGFSATHPGTDSITYQLNADTGQAVWLSRDQRLDDWTRQFFPASSGQGPFQEKAPSVALAAPTVTLKSDTMNGDVRTLRLQIASARHAAYAAVVVEAQGQIVAAALDGQPFDLSVLAENQRQRLQFNYAALPDKGFDLQLSIRSTAPVKITVQDISNGLPSIRGMTIHSRPASLMPAPTTWQDPTIVIKSFTFAR